MKLWLYEITYCGLSKVIQVYMKYLYIKYCEIRMNIHGVLDIFRNCINFRFLDFFKIRFVHLERNSDTLVKVNRPPSLK